jgi:hypothetical protein
MMASNALVILDLRILAVWEFVAVEHKFAAMACGERARVSGCQKHKRSAAMVWMTIVMA